MRALTVRPEVAGSLVLEDIAEPDPADGPILLDGVALGLCGTDVEIVQGDYGQAPPGADRLVLGHENLGRVAQAPADSGFAAGDLAVCMVRRPDPVPCPPCGAGEWDMCRNGRYTEHGIKGLHGFGRERWRATPDELVKLDPGLGECGVLVEPTSVVAKAWEQVDRIGQRAFWQPAVAAVTGAGPIGLLAALLAVQRGLRVHVFDIVDSGPKPELVAALGGEYHHGSLADSGIDPDVVIECTGVPTVVLQALMHSATDGIVCLTGVSDAGNSLPVDVGQLSRDAVLRNHVVFGTVNANRRHYDAAARALAEADRDWLRRLVTRRVPLVDYAAAFARNPDDVKVVLQLAQS